MRPFAFPFAFALAFTGCGSADPCDGKPAVCVTVNLTGTNVPTLDQLVIGVQDALGRGVHGGTGNLAPRIDLPVRFAALMPTEAMAPLTFSVGGQVGNDIVASGFALLQTLDNGRGQIDIPMKPGAPGDGGFPQDGGGDAGDGGVLPVVITPPSFSFDRVPASTQMTTTFTVNNFGAATVSFSSATLFPPVSGFTIDGSGTCTLNKSLPQNDSCTVVVSYQPVGPQSAGVTLRVVTSAGNVSATVHGTSPGWLVETLPDSVNYNAVWAADRDHVYAVGSSNGVYERLPDGWHARTGPGVGGAILTGVWAGAADDLYVVGSTGSIYHSTDHAMTWASQTLPISGNAQSVAGLIGVGVFASSSVGDIAIGSAAAGWGDEKSMDTVAVRGLKAWGGTMWAARADQLIRRDTGPVAWTPALDVAGAAAFRDVWGPTLTEFYAAGAKPACVTSPCGVIYHTLSPGNTVSRTVNGIDSFNGIFGTSATQIWAVGTVGKIVFSAGDDNWAPPTGVPTPSNTLNAIHGVDGELWAVGDAALILHLVQ